MHTCVAELLHILRVYLGFNFRGCNQKPRVPSLPSPFPSPPPLFPPLPVPPLPLEVGPLKPARGSGGAL